MVSKTAHNHSIDTNRLYLASIEYTNAQLCTLYTGNKQILSPNISADSETTPPDLQPDRENPQPRRSTQVRTPPDYLQY